MLNFRILGWIMLLCSAGSVYAFEGTITITCKKNTREHIFELKIKDQKAWMVSRFGGNKKYAGYLIDCQTRDFFTVSGLGRKVIIQYHADTLVRFYEQQGFKTGLSFGNGPKLSETNKVRVLNQQTATRYTAEKAEAWVGEIQTPLPAMIPLLRLLDAWGEIEFSGKTILEYTMQKGGDPESVKVNIVKEKIDDSWFILPKDYRAVNFSRLMEDKRNDPGLISLIRDFGEF